MVTPAEPAAEPAAALESLARVLRALRTAVESEPAAAGFPPAAAGRGCVQRCDSGVRDALKAVIDAAVRTLELHTPRRAGFWDAPVRCAHDNRPWPCRTITLLLEAAPHAVFDAGIKDPFPSAEPDDGALPSSPPAL